MQEPISTLLGHVDQSIDQRAHLVAALRAKLGVNSSAGDRCPGTSSNPLEPALHEGSGQPEPGAGRPPHDGQLQPQVQQPLPGLGDALPGLREGTCIPVGFTDVIAEYDRGLDARHRLIEALKAQLSKSAALPKTAPPGSPLEELDSVLTIRDLLAGQEPALGSERPTPQEPPPLPKPLFSLPASKPPAPSQEPPLDTAPLTPAPEAVVCADAPPPKKPRVVKVAEPPQGAAMDASAVADPGLGAQPIAQVVEQAALAARKAEMLRSLKAAEGVDAGTALPSAAAAQQPSREGAQVAASTAPAPEEDEVPAAGVAGKPVAPANQAPGGSTPPPGATAEQWEAYRQQCWKQYFEYCSAYQKYYDKARAEQGSGPPKPNVPAGRPATPTGFTSVAVGQGGPAPSAPNGRGSVVLPRALAHGRPQVAVLTAPSALVGLAAPLAPPPPLAPLRVPQHVVPPPRPGRRAPMGLVGLAAVNRVEEDIHSKLLGL